MEDNSPYLPSEAETHYLPSDWLDEIVPTCLPAPVDFVEHDVDGTWHLRLPIGDDARHDERYQMTIYPDHAYSFLERRIYEDFTLTVTESGNFWHSPFPADATNFCLAGIFTEDLFENVEELVAKANTEDMGKPLAPGEYEISCWHWSDDISMLFEVIDGKPSFRRKDHQ